jgi:hypothetical protein
MNKLNKVLTANPREFAALFGEVTGDPATQPGTDTTGLQRPVAEVSSSRSTRRRPGSEPDRTPAIASARP